jgi:hypothetical protein
MDPQADQGETPVDPEQDFLDALGPADEAPPPVDAAAEEAAEEAPDVDEDDEAPSEPEKYRVTVKNDAGEDEEQDLSLEELAAGFMLQRDYTRKTQEIAQIRQQTQQQYQQAVSQAQQAAFERIEQLQALVMQTAAPELDGVNWAQLAAQDPAEYVRLQARQQQLAQVFNHLEAQKAQHHNQLTQHQQQQRDQAIAQSADYLKREIPGFNAQKYQETLKAGADYGFAPDELNNVVDGRMVRVLHDAAQWRALQKAKPAAVKKVQAAPKVIKPSAPQPKPPRLKAAAERLKQNGRVEDLMAFL